MKNIDSGVHGYISIHALREEGDVLMSPPLPFPAQFLSTPSARRATKRGTAGR